MKLYEDGDESFHLDLSAVYNHNGLAEYLTEGGLRELPGGGWVYTRLNRGWQNDSAPGIPTHASTRVTPQPVPPVLA